MRDRQVGLGLHEATTDAEDVARTGRRQATPAELIPQRDENKVVGATAVRRMSAFSRSTVVASARYNAFDNSIHLF